MAAELPESGCMPARTTPGRRSCGCGMKVINRQIPVVEFTAAVELIKDEKGQVAGAVLQNLETGDYLVARAKTVIIATGGAGRMHYQGFPTSNHYGATADGLILGYRAGAPLLYQDTIQYHPPAWHFHPRSTARW